MSKAKKRTPAASNKVVESEPTYISRRVDRTDVTGQDEIINNMDALNYRYIETVHILTNESILRFKRNSSLGNFCG
jgi:hypothetical protein